MGQRPCASANRRTLLQGAAATLAVSGLRSPGHAAAKSPAGRPNILFILADDLGFGDLSCYGRQEYRTVTLDELARKGLMMTHGYSNSPVCTPTRVALITGRYQYRLRVGLEEPIIADSSPVGLPPGHTTLPSLLRDRGYRTALIGKWHMGWLPQYGPLKSGYDYFFGLHAGANYFTHSGDVHTGPHSGLLEGEAPARAKGYLTDVLADRAIAQTRRLSATGRPFFISLHFTAPHSPWQGPRDEPHASAIGNLNHRDGGSLEIFAEMVVAMDAAIAKVLRALDAAGVADDTIVVFTSDNGGERFSFNWPFRGQKYDLLEGGIRVPVIVRWPARIAAGRQSAQVMTSMDWLPTLLAAAGAGPSGKARSDGENLVDVLTGKEQPRDRKLFWRYKNREQGAVRAGRWKYFRRGNQEALYDLGADPREAANLREKHANLFAALRRDFDRWNATMLPYPSDSISAGR